MVSDNAVSAKKFHIDKKQSIICVHNRKREQTFAHNSKKGATD